MNKFVKTNIDKNNIVEEYVQSINGILQLPKKELTLFIELIKLDMNYVKKGKRPKNIADAERRKYLMDKCNFTRDNLSTYIKRLRTKGYVMRDNRDSLWVNPSIMPDIIRDTIQITTILKFKINESKPEDIQGSSEEV